MHIINSNGHNKCKYLDVFKWRWFLVILLGFFGLSLHLEIIKTSFSLQQGCTEEAFNKPRNVVVSK